MQLQEEVFHEWINKKVIYPLYHQQIVRYLYNYFTVVSYELFFSLTLYYPYLYNFTLITNYLFYT